MFVDFSITKESFEANLTTILVKVNKPMILESLVQTSSSFMTISKNLEVVKERILEMMAGYKDFEILDDDGFVLILENSRKDNAISGAVIGKSEKIKYLLDKSREYFLPLVQRVSEIYFCVLKIAGLKENTKISPKLFYKVFVSLARENLMFRDTDDEDHVSMPAKTQMGGTQETLNCVATEGSHSLLGTPDNSFTQKGKLVGIDGKPERKKTRKPKPKARDESLSKKQSNADIRIDEGNGLKTQGALDIKNRTSIDGNNLIPTGDLTNPGTEGSQREGLPELSLEEIQADMAREREHLEKQYEELVQLDEYIPMTTLKLLDLFIKQFSLMDRSIF
jgi:hypothetical protein